MERDYEYRYENDGVVITGSQNGVTNLSIPRQIDEYTVIGIEKKAFIGNQTLTQIALPDTVTTIGDWAFAHCNHLEQIIVPECSVMVGKEICIGCESLLQFGPCSSEWNILLPVLMKHKLAEGLYNPAEYGTTEWCKKVDRKIYDYIRLSDDNNYQGLWTFGEEDYTDRSFEKEIYEEERRKDKAELALSRLCTAKQLPMDLRTVLEMYLLQHTQETRAKETLQVLKERHNTEIAYFIAFTQIPGITRSDLSALLELLENPSAEICSFLINSSKELLQNKDFFDNLLS